MCPGIQPTGPSVDVTGLLGPVPERLVPPGQMTRGSSGAGYAASISGEFGSIEQRRDGLRRTTGPATAVQVAFAARVTTRLACCRTGHVGTLVDSACGHGTDCRPLQSLGADPMAKTATGLRHRPECQRMRAPTRDAAQGVWHNSEGVGNYGNANRAHLPVAQIVTGCPTSNSSAHWLLPPSAAARFLLTLEDCSGTHAFGHGAKLRFEVYIQYKQISMERAQQKLDIALTASIFRRFELSDCRHCHEPNLPGTCGMAVDAHPLSLRLSCGCSDSAAAPVVCGAGLCRAGHQRPRRHSARSAMGGRFFS